MTYSHALPGPSGPPVSINDQIERLIQRGLEIQDAQRAFRFLSNVSYYRLQGYLRPFLDHTGYTHPKPFLAGSSFESVVKRYEFDSGLRNLLLEAFNRIEVSIRTQWTYHLSFTHSGGQFSHLDPTFFYSGHSQNLEEMRQWYQRHGKASHLYDFADCPTWALAEVMTLGQLSRWYGDSIKQVRRAVANHYQLHESILRSLLRHLSLARNICAHHERFWDRNFITKLRIPTRMGQHKRPGSFFNTTGTGKPYNTLVMTAYLNMIIAGNSEWSGRLVSLMDSHSEIPEHEMGFVPGWRDLAIWR